MITVEEGEGRLDGPIKVALRMFYTYLDRLRLLHW